jgi:hypothetical protein
MTPRLNGRLTRTIGGILAVALATGCTDFLKASNPSAIQADDLANPLYINLMVNGVIGNTSRSLTTSISAAASSGTSSSTTTASSKSAKSTSATSFRRTGTYPLVIYVPLQRARFLADSVAGRLKTLLGDSASKDLRVARVLAYAGSSYDLLAENLCSIPVNGSAPYTPEETISKFAIPRLNEAIAVATAYKAATTNTTLQAAADSVINFAKLTAARSLLFVNDKAGARAFAVQVPATFEFRAYYSAQNARENNAFQNAAVGSPWVSMEPKNKRLNDPRVPHLVTPSGVQSLAAGNADTVTINGVRTIGAFIPKSTLMHSTYDGTTTGAVYTLGPNYIRIATYLEAQYIIAEADGPVASTLTFVNSRRAVGGQTAVTLAGAALMDELREQRRRDFFLDGHRLGDMRRYLKYDKIDNFPRGPYPGSISGEQFNDATCWPLPLSEIAGNPNVPRG